MNGAAQDVALYHAPQKGHGKKHWSVFQKENIVEGQSRTTYTADQINTLGAVR